MLALVDGIDLTKTGHFLRSISIIGLGNMAGTLVDRALASDPIQ